MSDAVPKSRGLGLKRLGGNATRTFIAQILAALLGVGISLLLGRTLGTAGIGTYAAALILPNMLVQLLEFGITYANVYHIGRGDVNAHEVMRSNLRIWAFLSAFGLTIASLVIWFKGPEWFPGIPSTMLVLASLAFPPALLQLYCLSILQGYQDFKRFNYLTVTVQATTFTLSAIFVLVFHWGVTAVIGAFVVGQVLALTITLVVLQPYLRRTPDSPELRQSWWEYGRQAASYGWKQHLSAVISFVNLRIDLFFVNLFLAPAIAGIYYVAIQFGEAMWIVSKVVSTVLLPRLAELHNEEKTRQELTPLVSRLVFNFTGLAAIVVAIVIKPVLRLWGPEFAPSAVVLWYLLPGIVMWSATRIIAYDFSARGRPELNSYLAGVVLVINVALNIILIPRIGMIGGALSTTIAYTANTFASTYLYRQFNDLASWKLFILQRDDIVLLGEAAKIALGKARPNRPVA